MWYKPIKPIVGLTGPARDFVFVKKGEIGKLILLMFYFTNMFK